MKMPAWIILAVLAVTMAAHAESDLAEGFAQPPRTAGSGLYLNWNQGFVTKEGISADCGA